MGKLPILISFLAVMLCWPASAQTETQTDAQTSAQTAVSLNSDPAAIIGDYLVEHEGEASKVKVFAAEDGSYTAQVYWVKNSLDENGNVRLDEKNPDKSLRSVPCDEIVLITGLTYNQKKQRWDGGKVYDPTRGIRANAACWFAEDGNLMLRGSLMGFSQTVVWKPL